tara:strand:- start:131 stop:619 length:489 start_codon:yes stop_codon:yes gene_type:complete
MDIPRNIKVTKVDRGAPGGDDAPIEPPLEGAMSSQSLAEANERADEALAREGKDVAINRDLTAHAVQFVPAIQTLINSSYHILDAELLNLKRQAHSYAGLDPSESKRFGLAVASLVKLAALENDLRQQNALDTLTDEQLKELASDTFKKLPGASKKDPGTNG